MVSRLSKPLLLIEELACERDDRSLFAPFSWQAKSGELWQLTGSNGAGKTTLLKTLAGLLLPYSGAIKWQLGATDYREQLCYIGHQPGLRDELSARENLQWQLQLRGQQTAIQPVLAQLGLAGFDDIPVAQLSAGQRRRVALARLWLEDARVWLLDEPFTAIDHKGREFLEQHLSELVAEGKLVIYTSHHHVNPAAKRVELRGGQVHLVTEAGA